MGFLYPNSSQRFACRGCESHPEDNQEQSEQGPEKPVSADHGLRKGCWISLQRSLLTSSVPQFHAPGTEPMYSSYNPILVPVLLLSSQVNMVFPWEINALLHLLPVFPLPQLPTTESKQQLWGAQVFCASALLSISWFFKAVAAQLKLNCCQQTAQIRIFLQVIIPAFRSSIFQF